MEKPNILWICVDQQRFDTIGCLNNPYIYTPNLDRLSREGVAFTRTYCQNPVCTPSRASFLTGLYPSYTHVTRNGNESFPDHVKLVTSRLADVGYDCGLVGKLHIASAWKGEEQRTDDGYRVFHYSHSPNQGAGNGNQYISWLNDNGISPDELFLRNGKGEYSAYRPDAPAEWRQTKWCADRAIEFMTEERTGPWLLSINFYDPHPPFDAPAELTERYLAGPLPEPKFREADLELQHKLKDVYHQTDQPHRPDSSDTRMIASYYGMIELVDEQVGRLLDTLETIGQRENTLIVFMSDHGEMLGDHGLSHKGCRFYDGAVRVPLIFSWKGHIQTGKVSEALVELTDVAPTLADAAGFGFKPCHGSSLLPLLQGKAPLHRHRSYVRCEYYNSLNPHLPHAPENQIPAYANMYVDDRFKLVVYHGLDIGELYDLERDPDEHENLWNDRVYEETKWNLLRKSFDASALFSDPGPVQIGRY
ncbi:MAG: sulfatase-like hydrolase/transferase [Paenibacillus sp.]|jgi:arylsulfatase A-like enzyme|nr:sulfatase-like hydrolase/transferase [Paenibacillus sp.]